MARAGGPTGSRRPRCPGWKSAAITAGKVAVVTQAKSQFDAELQALSRCGSMGVAIRHRESGCTSPTPDSALASRKIAGKSFRICRERKPGLEERRRVRQGEQRTRRGVAASGVLGARFIRGFGSIPRQCPSPRARSLRVHLQRRRASSSRPTQKPRSNDPSGATTTPWLRASSAPQSSPTCAAVCRPAVCRPAQTSSGAKPRPW